MGLKSNQKLVVLMISLFFVVACSTEQVKILGNCDINGDGKLNISEKNNCNLGQGDDSTENSDDVVQDDLLKSTPENVIAHIGVHMETAEDQLNLEYQETYWEDIQELVSLADNYEFKLNLEMTAQWADYITLDQDRLALVQEWQVNGHEIGFHHHGISHPNWDGYTNDESYTDDEGYIGDIDLMMDTIRSVSIDGIISTGSGTDEETDWPEETIYQTVGIPSQNCCLVARVESSEIDGVLKLGVRGYETDKPGVASLDDIEEAILTVVDGEYIGITLTDVGFAEHNSEIEELFSLLENYNVSVLTVGQIFEND